MEIESADIVRPDFTGSERACVFGKCDMTRAVSDSSVWPALEKSDMLR